MYLAYIFIFLQVILISLSFQNYKNDVYLKKIASYVLVLILTVISGFRYNVGRDFPNYELMYLDPNNVRNLFIEPVWQYSANALRNLGFSSVAWFLCTSFVINSCFITGIRKLSRNFYLSVAFYLAMPHLFLESFNIVRQFVAMAIIFRFSYLFFQKKYYRFILIILIAACFHKSAILSLPLFFLSLIHFSNLMLGGVVLICFIMRNAFLSLVMKIISSVSIYAGYSDNIVASESASGLYAVVCLLVSLFIIIRFWKPRTYEINILKNLSVMSFCIYLMFYTFQAGMRIGFYLLPYFVLLVPSIKTQMKVNGAFVAISSIFSIFFLFTLKSGFIQIYQFRF